MKKRLLLIVSHRYNRAASQRFRIEQFLPALTEAGYDVTLSNIISEKDDKQFYKRGNYLWKFVFVLRAFLQRFCDICKAKNYDLIFLHREAQMLGTSLIERRLAKKGVPIIYDFDDAIWLEDTSDGNKNLAWLKRTSKTGEICQCATMVSVGNQYLADYARKFNNNVFILPTVLNTDYHKCTTKTESNRICIGWTGTQPTMKHLETVIPVLKQIKAKYGDKVFFKVITDDLSWHTDLEDVHVVKWSLENEISELCEFDIGIMPLPEDKWSRGKCGFKGLQCMSLSLPVVMSAVGTNCEIIENGVNGFLVTNEEEWFEKLSLLIENADLRKKIGNEARQTIEKRYSVEAWRDVVVAKFNELVIKKHY